MSHRPCPAVCLAAFLLVSSASPGAGSDSPGSTIHVPRGWEGAYDFGYAPVLRVGDTVIVSGVPAGGPGTYEEKIERMYQRVGDLLESAGAGFADVVELTTFHVEPEDSASFQAEFDRYMPIHRKYLGEHRPAWSAVGITTLLSPSAVVEMRVVAVAGSGAGSRVEWEEPPAAEEATADEVSATRIDLRIDPRVELYFWVRSQAARERPAEAGYEEAVAAARRVQEMMGAWGGWGPLDAQILSSGLAAARDRFAAFPEPYERRGREISLRDDAVALASALLEVEPFFLQTHWPARRARAEAALESLDEELLPRHQAALAYMMESLGIEDPGLEVSMYLVGDIHPPGASTYFLEGGEKAAVLGLAELEGPLLHETVLHEATHALDLASSESGSVFETLRKMLAEHGVDGRDPLMHDVPHTLMFIQAAATMRHVYDPDHTAYGEVSGVYERSRGIPDVALPVWHRHLAGEIDREEALRQIVDGVLTSSRRL